MRFSPSRHGLTCRWPPLPTPAASTFGENDVRNPYRSPTARIVARTSTDVSAAATGDSAATDTSNCPGAYSGCSCSTRIPCAAKASSRSRP